MGIKLNGFGEIERELEKRLGKKRLTKVIDKALTKGAEVIKSEVEKGVASYKDTGALHEEVSITKPYVSKGVRTISIKWKGPQNRYRIVHLNEHGTVKNPNPRGKGVINRAIRRSRETYFNQLKKELRRYL
ncbi:HK97 gp10 family phage protein [Staphylococcus xylosus]